MRSGPPLDSPSRRSGSSQEPRPVGRRGRRRGGRGGAGARRGLAGAIRARDQALAQLAQVADYFRRTEPHSPVSYLVQRAITWGQMPLEAWLADVIKDANTLDEPAETLGPSDKANRRQNPQASGSLRGRKCPRRKVSSRN